MNRFNKKIKSGAGFTLIELLVVLGIASLLSAVAVPSYNLIRNNAALNSEVQNFISALRLTQNFAVSAQGGTGHTLTIISESSYKIDISPTHYTDNGITIIQASVPQVTFNKLSGTTSCNPTCTFTIGLPTHNKRIEINNQGTISY